MKRMRERIFQIVAKEYSSLPELSENDQELILAARKAAKNAYAPYSRFQVGAALILENGEIIEGNNQENADYTDGMCAERVALFYANAKYPKVAVKSLAVSAQNTKGLINGPAQPCGSCRQVLVETEHRYKQAIRLILDGAKKIMVFEGVENLLPFAFKPGSLD